MASSITSADDSWLTNNIFDWGESRWICRAASIPLSVGRPMSREDQIRLQFFGLTYRFESV
jgi:hypothetical protein